MSSISFQVGVITTNSLGGHFLSSSGAYISGFKYDTTIYTTGQRVSISVPSNAVTFEWSYPTDARATN
ncbi:hypothetical protein [Dysgonomonas capnocytophagoides]|uniref:hypothetical protein n=1 Tax=Dysgonomonas capnocytophagoides TaxID=45254 RepID=UPI00333E85BC